MNKIVYDCIDPSPFYDQSGMSPSQSSCANENCYFDENDLCELVNDEQQNAQDLRKYPYGPTVPYMS